MLFPKVGEYSVIITDRNDGQSNYKSKIQVPLFMLSLDVTVRCYVNCWFSEANIFQKLLTLTLHCKP